MTPSLFVSYCAITASTSSSDSQCCSKRTPDGGRGRWGSRHMQGLEHLKLPLPWSVGAHSAGMSPLSVQENRGQCSSHSATHHIKRPHRQAGKQAMQQTQHGQAWTGTLRSNPQLLVPTHSSGVDPRCLCLIPCKPHLHSACASPAAPPLRRRPPAPAGSAARLGQSRHCCSRPAHPEGIGAAASLCMHASGSKCGGSKHGTFRPAAQTPHPSASAVSNRRIRSAMRWADSSSLQ